ncbi:MAG: sensor histidine kinase [Anaerolineae bacterium]|nr:sensor histidine kinase [Anaerolineae bacterium]
MPTLPADFLARSGQQDWIRVLREDLEDALKEYSQLDLLVEIIQNALDAEDYYRYILICQSVNRDPESSETIKLWNQAVLECIENDYKKYAKCSTTAERAVLYQTFLDDRQRRRDWWETLARHFGGVANFLESAALMYIPEINITVRFDTHVWIEIEDNGVGMLDIGNCFHHKVSNKRGSFETERRLGTRGSHGWGLTAVLAMSDRIEVLSHVKDTQPAAYAFSGYASFTKMKLAEPQNEEIDLHKQVDENLFSERLRQDTTFGTHIRVRVNEISDTDLLGNTLNSYTHDKFISLLRLYTPIGQVNDFLLHPAYHNVRKGDIKVTLRSVRNNQETISEVDFDVFRIAEHRAISHYDFNAFVNAGWPSDVSVHTIYRASRGSDFYLSAAEIQPARSLMRTLEDWLREGNRLPGYIDQNDSFEAEIPRGFYLALSGGMKAEYIVRQPRSISAAFRGFILSETARPTLGRKHVLDQRQAIAKAAIDHEREYDDVRKKVLPEAIPPTASPAAARWRREFFMGVKERLSKDQPLSSDLMVWASDESREARVMLVFAEMLQRKIFGDLRILRVHLKDKYDFAFLYKCDLGNEGSPNAPTMDLLHRAGYGQWIDRKIGSFLRYGLGEFKAFGDQIFDDFDEDNPRKAADAIDLLICWTYDSEIVADAGWLDEEVSDNTKEFQGQTHLWRPSGSERRRSRVLPIVSLATLIEKLVANNQLAAAPRSWPDILPQVYF